MKKLATTVACFVVFLAVAVSVQAQMEMPKPGPELKKLDYFAGTWTLEGDMKPSAMGPGGKMTETENNKWLDGGYFLAMNSDFKSAMGNGTEVSYMGYNLEDKVYTYDAFSSMGEAEHSKGTVSGDTWTFTSDEKMGGQTVKGRFIMKILSPTSYTFKFDMSQDGTNWNTVMEGKATKNK
jgi:Protein of unknown function (DUF1579)